MGCRALASNPRRGARVSRRAWCLLALAIVVAAGTFTDTQRFLAPQDPSVLAVDFHVHASPGDGLLPVWEIQREAGRRGLDAIAITNHNHNLATRIARGLGLVRDYPIVIDGQELTTPRFHLAAVGARHLVDWRLPAADAIAAIQRAGGVAIAAHPAADTLGDANGAARKALDGAEIGHPAVFGGAKSREGIRRFFADARQLNPGLAAIGSSDFHWGGPMGVCRTYAFVERPSAEGLLDAVRRARTVATCPGNRITGGPQDVAALAGRIPTEQPRRFGYGLPTWIALSALIALAAAVPGR